MLKCQPSVFRTGYIIILFMLGFLTILKKTKMKDMKKRKRKIKTKKERIEHVKNHNSKPKNKNNQHPIPTGYCKQCEINLYGKNKKPITVCDLVDCKIYGLFSLTC